MKLYNQGFPRVLHQRQTPSAYEIKLMNRVSDLERLVYGEGNYKSFNLMLREEAATNKFIKNKNVLNYYIQNNL